MNAELKKKFLEIFENSRKADKLGVIYKFRRDLPKEELSLMLSYWWIMTEFPNQYSNKMLHELFKIADKKLLMSPESFKVFDSLPSKIKVFRGVQSLSKKAKIKGFSWTLDKAKAKWFASRFCSMGVEKGKVYEATINKEDIYFYTNGRGEAEIILNPTKLKNVREVLN